MNLSLSPEVEEEEAVRRILSEIRDGAVYPPSGGKGCVTAGMFLQSRLDDDDIEALLCALLAGNASGWESRLRALCNQGLSDWLRENRPELIKDLVLELRKDDPDGA
jgi:hypothetical protein